MKTDTIDPEMKYSEEAEGYIPRPPSKSFTPQELAKATTTWLPWLKSPELRLVAANGYRSHPDQRDVKEARWGRYVAAVAALGYPPEIAECFRDGPTTPEIAFRRCLNKSVSEAMDKQSKQIFESDWSRRVEAFRASPLGKKFPPVTAKTEGRNKLLVWGGELTGRNHAPRIAAGGGFSYGVARCDSTRRREALNALGLVEVQQWHYCQRAWTHTWTKDLPTEDLENAAAFLS